MLCTSGFFDDFIFAHKPSLLDVAAQLKRSLGLGYKPCAVLPVAGQRTHGTTFRALKVTSQVATPGAESAVYDCLVLGAFSPYPSSASFPSLANAFAACFNDNPKF